MKITKHFRLLSLLFVFGFVAMGASAQNITVKGTVKDNKGEPMIGVNVTEVGTQNGTITNFDGKYELKVSEKSQLNFSFIGYMPQIVPVAGKRQIDVTMGEDTKNLEEVIVVGYGTQRKEAVTGSVATVKGDLIREVPASNVSQALQGRIAGVQMTQTSTKPGASMQIRIRGSRSINATNDPLVVLDGIPFSGTLSDISTEDIKSIDVLKDASATAIYGSRGANGVLLITTNKGTKGQKAHVYYNAYYGVKDAVQYKMMSAEKFAAMRALAGKVTTPGSDEPSTLNPDNTYTYSADTNWQDLFYRTGQVQSHDVSVGGSTDASNYKFGVNYYNDKAVLPGSDYTRYSIRGSLDQSIGKYLNVGFTTNNNFSITNGASLGLGGVINMSPLATPYNSDGSLKTVIHMPLDNQWLYTKETIENLGDKWADKAKAFGSYNSAYGELSIPGVQGLKARVNIGANFRMTNSGNYVGIGVFSDNAANPNTASINNSLSTNWTIENLLTYDKVFASKHHVNVVGMYSAEESRYNSSSISRKNISGDNFQYFNLGNSSTSSNDDITINPNYQGYSVSGLMSWMGRVMYSYDDKYMLSATLRSDASSRLAVGHKWHTYPAVSLGWNIRKEAFMENVDWINNLKIRAGYGQTSNQSVEPYATLGSLSSMPYNFGSTYATGYYVTQLPNPKLGWEYSITKNLGLDFTLLNNRLSGTFEYYITDTKDLLLSVSMPATSGVGSYMANVGSTQNKGWELTLNGTIIENLNGWTWDAGVNFYGNKNKLVSLASGEKERTNDWLFVGHSLNVIYDYKNIGLYQTDEEAQMYEGSAGKAGMIKVLYTGEYDANGKPTRIINSTDRQVIECDPDIQGGFNTRVAYKGIDLSIVGAFQGGGILNSVVYGSNGYLNLLSGRRGNIDVDYWTSTNTSAKYPNPAGPRDGDNLKYASTLGYFDGSYLKIRTITLGYNFPAKLTKVVGIEKARIYFTAQNPLVLFSAYNRESGLDPEPNSYANDNGNMAVKYGDNLKRILAVGYNTPTTRNYLMGINITF